MVKKMKSMFFSSMDDSGGACKAAVPMAMYIFGPRRSHDRRPCSKSRPSARNWAQLLEGKHMLLWTGNDICIQWTGPVPTSPTHLAQPSPTPT